MGMRLRKTYKGSDVFRTTGLPVALNGFTYILASVTCFSVVSLAVKKLNHIPFAELVFWRGIICLGIAYYFVWQKGLSPWGNNKKVLALRGLAGTCALLCFFYTLHAIPLATAVTIQYLSPIFTVLVAGLFFNEAVRGRHWVAALMGFLGVWIIEGYDPSVSVGAAVIGIGGALASAFAYNSVRHLRESDHEWVIMFYFPLVATVVSGPIAISNWQWPVGWDWGLLAVVGILTQIAQLFLTRGYSMAPAASIASVNYIGVIYAIIFGSLLFHEPISWSALAGILLILIGVAFSST
ncbi:MAG: DMT family transporter [Bdellovibrionales bacterium]